MEEFVLETYLLLGTHCILTYRQVRRKPCDSLQLPQDDTITFAGTRTYFKLSMATLPFGQYVSKVKVDSIVLRIESIIRSNYVVLHLLEGQFYRSGISNLHTWGKIGIIAVQSHLLDIILAQVWYETGQRRKVSRVYCNSWLCGGYLNASWRTVLQFVKVGAGLPK